jgi:hypothetical protein
LSGATGLKMIDRLLFDYLAMAAALMLIGAVVARVL